MKKRFVLGLSRDREVVYGNFEFLDGSRGAISIFPVFPESPRKRPMRRSCCMESSIRPVCFGTGEGQYTRAYLNVKGEDLLFLDKPIPL